MSPYKLNYSYDEAWALLVMTFQTSLFHVKNLSCGHVSLLNDEWLDSHILKGKEKLQLILQRNVAVNWIFRVISELQILFFWRILPVPVILTGKVDHIFLQLQAIIYAKKIQIIAEQQLLFNKGH